MKELISHLENLLRDNECVIIPNVGGFVSYYAPARRVEGEHLFLPPYRTVGFNSSLTINDGLLIQAYMQAHDASYPTAQLMLERDVKELRDMLENDGKAELPGLGQLTQNFDGQLEFHPQAEGIHSSALYGLGSFQMKTLQEIKSEKAIEEPRAIMVAEPAEKKRNTVVIHINRTWLNNAVAVAAAVILFFFLSTPVANTYVEQDSYASLGNVEWFDQIRSQSFATTLLNVPKTPQGQHNQKKEAKTREKHNTIREEKIPLISTKPAVKKQTETAKAKAGAKQQTLEKKVEAKAAPKVEPKATVQGNSKGKTTYHIIVSSVANEKDANTIIRQLADKGYKGATMIKGDGRVRVALQSGTDQAALNKKMIELRKNKLFKSAWMLTLRN